jgi:Flp pilus assembly protein TadD
LIDDQSDDGIALAKRAIELNPNLAVAHVPLALRLIQQGRYKEAVEPGETAVRLSPHDPLRSIMLAVRGIYFLMLGRKSDLLANARKRFAIILACRPAIASLLSHLLKTVNLIKRDAS